MGIACAPINLFAGILQLTLEVFYFFMQLIGFGPTPVVSDVIGSIFGCNLM
ncbi:hypothetical protein RAS2_13450 [Phycisphaerae bacterium RAS2]|jgi:hypothetical protein|nr:hypothetical protein RAS2_13450 [Phycisphaerae bacterium RAS2]